MSAPGEGFVDSLRNLSAAQKSSKGAPLYSVVVNRPLGRFFAAVAYQLGMTPNQVTIISAIFTYGGIVVIAVAAPSWSIGVIVTVLLVLGYALDASDGQLARLRGGGSLMGEWLDHMIDSGKIVSLHLAVAIMILRYFPVPDGWAIVGIGFAIFYTVHFFGFLLTDLLGRANGAPPRTGSFSPIMAALKLPTDYGLLCLVFVLLGLPIVFLVLYTTLAIANAGYTILVMGKWAKRLQALDAANTASSGSTAALDASSAESLEV